MGGRANTEYVFKDRAATAAAALSTAPSSP